MSKHTLTKGTKRGIYTLLVQMSVILAHPSAIYATISHRQSHVVRNSTIWHPMFRFFKLVCNPRIIPQFVPFLKLRHPINLCSTCTMHHHIISLPLLCLTLCQHHMLINYPLEPQEIQREVKLVESLEDNSRRLWPSSGQQNTVHTTSCSSNVLWSRTPVERSHPFDNPSVLAEAQ